MANVGFLLANFSHHNSQGKAAAKERCKELCAREGVTPARKMQLEELRDVCYSLFFFSLVVLTWIYVTLLLLFVLINCHRRLTK